MEQKNTTALIAAFTRAYHSETSNIKIIEDKISKMLLSENEYDIIAESISNSIKFFKPDFVGTQNEALDWVVNNQLCPSSVGRAAFCEKELEKAVNNGIKQYIIFYSSYDTFAYRQPYWTKDIQIFELDVPAIIQDKQNRINRAGINAPSNTHFLKVDLNKENWKSLICQNEFFSKDHMSFCNILGVAYYIPKNIFKKIICLISQIVPKGSVLVFDYPDKTSFNENNVKRAKTLAKLADIAEVYNEDMFISYCSEEIENILSEYGFCIEQKLTPCSITEKYFKEYNAVNTKNTMIAFDNVNYCIAVKK